jgi:predicted Zn-dependent peptidase
MALDYFQSRYVPDRIAIAVVGRFDPQQVQTYFDANLSDFDRLSNLRLPVENDTRIDEQKLTLASSGNTAYALVATAAPGVASPDYPAFVVLETLLGEGRASRLFRRVRDTMGFGYEVGVSYQADRAAPLVVYIEWDAARSGAAPSAPGSAMPTPAQALHLLTAQIAGILSDPPTTAEMTRAHNLAIGQYALLHERTRDRAFLLAWYEVMGLGVTFDVDLPRRIAVVTQQDVLRAARVYLSSMATALALPSTRSPTGP